MHYENREYGRRVEHRVVASLFGIVRSVIDHRLQRTLRAADQILADDDERHAGRTYVLLRTAVDHTVLLHIDRTAHDIRRHIGNERDRRIDILVDLRTVDGVVGRNVEIIRIGRDFVTFRNIGIVLILGRSDDLHFAVELSLLSSLLRPNTGLEVGSFLFQQVRRNLEELSRSTAAQEHYGIVVGNVQQVAPQLLGFGHDTLPTRSTVRNLQQADACVVEITDSLNGRFYRLSGQYAGSCVEIVLFHKTLTVIKL